MDTMHATQARDHIEMVDRIVARTERSLRIGGEFFLVWGIVGAAVTLIFQLYGVAANGRLVLGNAAAMSAGHVPGAVGFWVLPLLIAAGVVFSIIRGRQLKTERCSLLQREFFSVLWISLGMAALVNVGAFYIFPGVANGAIWTVSSAIVLLYIASHGNRFALAGAIILIASLVVANFALPVAGYSLAAGMLLGYAGFGLASLISRD